MPDPFDTLREKIPSFVPQGKVVKVVGSYSCSTLAGKDNVQITQSCDNVVCYFSDNEKRIFWVTFNDMTSSALNDPKEVSIFSTTVYSDGIYALRMTRWGKTPKEDSAAQVEISNISESYDTFSPYAIGIGYTLEYLFSPSNRLLGAYLIGNGDKQISMQNHSNEIFLKVSTSFKSPDGLSGEVKCLATLDGGDVPFLKSFIKEETDRMGDQVLERQDKITVSSWLNLENTGRQFPKEAAYVQILRGKEIVHYSFLCKSVELVEKFPSPPPIPPKSDVVDKRLGITVRTGDAPSVISEEIKDYVNKNPKQDL